MTTYIYGIRGWILEGADTEPQTLLWYLLRSKDDIAKPPYSLAVALRAARRWPDIVEPLLNWFPGDADDLAAVQAVLDEEEAGVVAGMHPECIQMARAWCARLAMQMVLNKTRRDGDM